MYLFKTMPKNGICRTKKKPRFNIAPFGKPWIKSNAKMFHFFKASPIGVFDYR